MNNSLPVKTYIRADGNEEIGLGHLVRCLALARMLPKEFSIHFVCSQCPPNIVREIVLYGFGFHIIEHDNQFLDLLTGEEIAVIDHYGISADFQKEIKKLGCKLVCIDDIHDKCFYADLIINPAPGVKPTDYKAAVYTQFALGLAYVLLRPAFLKFDVNNESIVSDSILVCFGGSDSKNITQLVVEILRSDKRFKLINVVVGDSYQHIARLEQSILDDERFRLYISIDETYMTNLMISSSVAILPSSGILLEALSLKTKVISGFYADNQKLMFNSLLELDGFISAFDFSEQSIREALNKSFTSKINLHNFLIDGKSQERISACFQQLKMEKRVSLRKAAKQDLEKTYEWSSDKEIRKFFLNPNPVSLESHRNWFLRKIQEPNCLYLIGIIDGIQFGSIRFDSIDNYVIVSFVIDSKFQSRGLGTIIVKAGMEMLVNEQFFNFEFFKAEVHENNIASLKIFKKLGYTETSINNSGFHQIYKINNYG